MNYNKLKLEIDNDPESIGYAGKTDLAVADLLNARRYVGDYLATFKTILSELGETISNDLISSMEAAASSSKSVERILNVLDNGVEVNLGDAVTRGMLDAFGANAALALSETDAIAIKALAENQISRSQQLGFGTVKSYDVRRANQ